ncbi:glycerophosphodiester phosphodiesterase family protein [Oerskovia sp. M15]
MTSDASVSGAMTASWRATERLWPRLLATLAVVALAALVVAAGVVALALVPTRVADAHAPGAAPVVAGVSLTVVQVVGFVLAGFVAALLTLVVVAVAGSARRRCPTASLARGAPRPRGGARAGPRPSRRPPRLGEATTRGACRRRAGCRRGPARPLRDEHPRHDDARARGARRGDRAPRRPGRGVENSIASLESAAALGADYVELDVLQTADGGLVVFHDLTLRRLAGSSRAVHTMTLDELTSTTVRQGGFEATVLSLREFVERAKDLDVPLLVELKAHGHESPSFVADVVALLREEGVADDYLVQSIYPEQADEVRALGPEIAVGYVVPFLRGPLGNLPVDFIAIEQSSDSSRVRAEARAAGIDVYVWTVTDPAAMRAQLRSGVDGIITSSPAARSPSAPRCATTSRCPCGSRTRCARRWRGDGQRGSGCPLGDVSARPLIEVPHALAARGHADAHVPRDRGAGREHAGRVELVGDDPQVMV